MANIVVIEDTPANLDLMCYLLDAFGHTVLTATDGDEGLELVRRTVPELVICDVHLPKVDGYEVARSLKSDPEFSNIPILAVTALAMVGDREKGLQAGFDGYLYKPIEPESFVSEVERFLHVKHHGTSPLPQTVNEPYVASTVRIKLGKILVVDDSAVNLELFRDLLEPMGYEISLTNNAAEAYSRACDSPPDLILSDIHMPVEDGFAFFRRIKLNACLSAIPFIFISSTMHGDKARKIAQKRGASRFLVRPIEPQVFLDEIAAVLAEKHR
ncbi:response regulator [Undibacterium sp.]|jgi:two-component system cell cycle response regulator|uniref:response regulator n=1 Tax=Undibacterium sp. TaxID=1914977 RepID=UPI002C864037|nr:response regulator [Undibacterium sp.]HTD03884.1 response regulator [Undibacterium sp.]